MTPTAVGGEAPRHPATHGNNRIQQIAVVIPVYNEEQHLERALTAVQSAADRAERELPGVAVQVVVVLDSCTDRSAAIAAAVAGEDVRFVVLPASFRSVGKSRQAGVGTALGNVRSSSTGDGLAGMSLRGVWLANTDADSCVPPHWLVRQLELAALGFDVVLGTVQPDPHGMHHELLARWHARHAGTEDHSHVYGANLGVRASSYLAAGGFPGVDFDEDQALVNRLRSSGAGIAATDTTRVLTSGRTVGRAPRGFAAYLLALARP
ncbi:glycosyltransferase involved in cell wall biosynthesis [Pseudarthrobacter defluvii]|uniref:glycosyltransferase n=1 Tax=Pseudarthrobacter defluvii TaxID=410837 RepID=UPI0027801F41|nr:glycosyltransferase [Pseudarthrobacter defluvii]MDQ0770853.1 glycosyltransferase involved in cell wall biosynthesis [Pseudarthrobacter defluvii]